VVPATANIQSRNAIPTGKVGEPRIWYPNSVKKVIEAKGLLAEKGSYCALREACSFGTRVLEPAVVLGLVSPGRLSFLPLGAFVSVLDRRSCRRLSQ